MSLSTFMGLPIADLETIMGLPVADLATIMGLGPLPEALGPITPGLIPTPTHYYPLDGTLADLMGGDDLPGSYSYVSDGKLNQGIDWAAGPQTITTTPGDMVATLFANWAKTTGGEWVLRAFGNDDTGHHLFVTDPDTSGGLLFHEGGDPSAFPELVAGDEFAYFTLPSPVSVSVAKGYITALWNNGLGAFWRDGQWMEPAP